MRERGISWWLLLILIVLWFRSAATQQLPDYRNPQLPIEQRVKDLESRMTLEEKVEIMSLRNVSDYKIVDPTGTFTDARAHEIFKRMYDPDFRLSAHDGAILRNAAQRYLLEKSRLSIPAIFWDDAPQGFMSDGATMFPAAIALASSWDTDLVRRVFDSVADEMAASGVRQAFAPLLDVAREPRWGRVEETYGEDPFLVSRIGLAAVQGLQGKDFLIGSNHVAATIKHFTAHGEPEGGTNMAPGNFSERVLRETFLYPFKVSIEEGDAASVMASYNEVDGVPMHVNKQLLDDVLRKEWGFRGYVTSDGDGLDRLVTAHHVASNSPDAARQALNAGVDLDLGKGDVYPSLVEEVKAGRVPEWQVDRAVSRILFTIFRLGLFEHPYVDPDYAAKTMNSKAHQALAQEAAEREAVLLKNDGHLLPLDLTKIKTIAVIGPDAADVHLGGYSREPLHSISILDGIRDYVGKSATVLYAEGARINEGKQGWTAWQESGKVVVPDEDSQRRRIAEAVSVAHKADVVILVMGENESVDRESWKGHPGDLDSLDMVGDQDKLIQAIMETGKPTAMLLINGRPLTINYATEHVPAILECWYMGQEGGTAAARILFGAVNPGGKLPITFPRSVGDLPAYYNHKPTSEPDYVFGGKKPLFPFGWGLSYTDFRFENLRLDHAAIGPNAEVIVKVDVTNAGDRAGDEVAQLYIHQRVASTTQPVKTLKGFQRVNLRPGEKTTVQFHLGPKDLEILNREMRPAVEPGVFDIMVGPNSVNTISAQLQVVDEAETLHPSGAK